MTGRNGRGHAVNSCPGTRCPSWRNMRPGRIADWAHVSVSIRMPDTCPEDVRFQTGRTTRPYIRGVVRSGAKVEGI